MRQPEAHAAIECVTRSKFELSSTLDPTVELYAFEFRLDRPSNFNLTRPG